MQVYDCHPSFACCSTACVTVLSVHLEPFLLLMFVPLLPAGAHHECLCVPWRLHRGVHR
jgi:hypothetical protein